MTRKKITIVCSNQFGYLTDTFNYCLYLREQYNIHYICIDFGKPKIEMEGVQVSYMPLQRLGFGKWFDFYQYCKGNLADSDVYFVKHFFLCSLLLLNIDRKTSVCDTRTGSVRNNKFVRSVENALMSLEMNLFKHKTAISHSLAKKLYLFNYQLLPLGTTLFKRRDHLEANALNLIYVGTLTGRKLQDTLFGFRRFVEQSKLPRDKISYQIIGDGEGNELNYLKQISGELELDDIVTFHGRLPNTVIEPFLQNSNVGISYVPITPYYDVQPVTKTLEYLSSGMPVVGTATKEQKIILSSTVLGELCNDNAESFCTALDSIYQRIDQFEPAKLADTVAEFNWRDIAKSLDNYLQLIMCSKA
ncbi:glycosyltransferase [Vibrio sp. IRLE0018]|uniref:glycosyltransferase n=1 Tax=Vibrio floridensis TaxID=2908007 RepID=UPI001F19377F|nr:glycosyltransferase [Vibrio floridensis]MCF8780053.1 glycosyltransferase [Vibrio floridensis]